MSRQQQLRLDLEQALLTPEDLAERFPGTDRRTIIEWCRDLDWPHIEIKRRIYFTPDQYREIVAAHMKAPAKKAAASPENAMPAPAAPGLTIAGQTKRSSARRTA